MTYNLQRVYHSQNDGIIITIKRLQSFLPKTTVPLVVAKTEGITNTCLTYHQYYDDQEIKIQ